MKLVPILLLSSLLLTPAHAACQATNRGAAAIKKAALSYDANALAALMDIDKLLDRALAGLPGDSDFRRGVRAGVSASLARGFETMLRNIPATDMQLVDQTAAPGLVLIRKEGKTPGNGIDYLEFEVDQSGCFVDWTSLMSGTRASSLMRQTMASMSKDSNTLATLFGLKQTDKAQLDKVQGLGAALRSRDFKKALALIDTMPTELRNSYDFTLVRIGLLAQIDAQSAEYRAALEELARNHGNEPRAQFMLIDHYFLTKQYNKALAAIGALQARVGVDEENEMLRGSILSEAGRGDEAVAAMRKVLALTPDRKSSYFLLIGTAISAKHYQDALDTMDQASARFKLSFPHKNLQAEESYAELITSPEYKAWRKKHPG